MKTLKRMLSILLAVMALAGMMAVPAMAATDDSKTVELYAYDEDEDAYIASSHANSCVASCVETGTNTYSITFKVISYGGATGYISSFAGTTVSYSSTEVDATSTPITFTAVPTVDPDGDGTVDGTVVAFTVSAKMGTATYDHEYSNGAIVIK